MWRSIKQMCCIKCVTCKIISARCSWSFILCHVSWRTYMLSATKVRPLATHSTKGLFVMATLVIVNYHFQVNPYYHINWLSFDVVSLPPAVSERPLLHIKEELIVSSCPSERIRSALWFSYWISFSSLLHFFSFFCWNNTFSFPPHGPTDSRLWISLGCVK